MGRILTHRRQWTTKHCELKGFTQTWLHVGSSQWLSVPHISCWVCKLSSLPHIWSISWDRTAGMDAIMEMDNRRRKERILMKPRKKKDWWVGHMLVGMGLRLPPHSPHCYPFRVAQVRMNHCLITTIEVFIFWVCLYRSFFCRSKEGSRWWWNINRACNRWGCTSNGSFKAWTWHSKSWECRTGVKPTEAEQSHTKQTGVRRYFNNTTKQREATQKVRCNRTVAGQGGGSKQG